MPFTFGEVQFSNMPTSENIPGNSFLVESPKSIVKEKTEKIKLSEGEEEKEWLRLINKKKKRERERETKNYR